MRWAHCLGLDFDDGKLAFLTEVLRRRVEATRCGPEVYLAQLERRGAADELDALAEELTVGETYFFRNREQFRALIETAVPGLASAVLRSDSFESCRPAARRAKKRTHWRSP